MAPFTASNVWRALVIALFIQGCSSFQNGCSDDLECMYDCSPSQLQMFNCRGSMNASYTPHVIGSQSFCCPGYYKTASGVCSMCRDGYFMLRLNNCCYCKPCKNCDTAVDDTIKEICTHESNTVCWIETDPTPYPGLTCPTEGLPTTTGSPGIEPTGANHSNISCTFEKSSEIKSDKKWEICFYVLLPFSIISVVLLALALYFCYCLCRLGDPNGDEVNSGKDTWKGALTPFAQKFRMSIPCTGSDGSGGGDGSGAGGGVRPEMHCQGPLMNNADACQNDRNEINDERDNHCETDPYLSG